MTDADRAVELLRESGLKFGPAAAGQPPRSDADRWEKLAFTYYTLLVVPPPPPMRPPAVMANRDQRPFRQKWRERWWALVQDAGIVLYPFCKRRRR